ncbi:hypothetical protein JRO89_XS14G0098200 [Xanthoceras sorbifolium]|uniref:Uncharacterized protein n=1 Tax=Xanthoceras sorbifolium TaxID=99658 RepID=A0ABQ8H4P3_9ROSI|nr:hypothetical protein JRO89_XS14G0098200 [Xanthoceras sorbifolium]
MECQPNMLGGSLQTQHLHLLSPAKLLDRILQGSLVFYLYLGITTSLCHHPNVAHTLGKLNLLSSELGQLILSVVVLHSIVEGLYLASSMFAVPGATMKDILSQLSTLALIMFIIFAVLRPLTLCIIRNTTEGKPVKSAKQLASNNGLEGVLDPSFHLDRQKFWQGDRKFVVDALFQYRRPECLFAQLHFELQRLSLEAYPSSESDLRRLQSMLPTDELRVLCCIHYEDNVNGIITLIKASNPIEISPICAYIFHLTQLIRRAAPFLAPYESQRGKSETNFSDRIMCALSRFSKTSSVPITIQPLKIIASYKTMHETICKLAIEKLIPLIIVPFLECLEFHGKIVSHLGVRITMIRIDFKADDDNNKSERYQDESLINEFKSKAIGNASVENNGGLIRDYRKKCGLGLSSRSLVLLEIW